MDSDILGLCVSCCRLVCLPCFGPAYDPLTAVNWVQIELFLNKVQFCVTIRNSASLRVPLEPSNVTAAVDELKRISEQMMFTIQQQQTEKRNMEDLEQHQPVAHILLTLLGASLKSGFSLVFASSRHFSLY